jgi:predicted phosphodiesterase
MPGDVPPNSPLGRIIGLFADVHGAQRTLLAALVGCRAAGAEQIGLLGDLFDRAEQADGCARALAGWPTIGVWGNHEREIAQAATVGGALAPETVRLLNGLGEQVIVGDVCLTHEAAQWGRGATLARLSGGTARGEFQPDQGHARITFAGHTHHRAARDERGPLDLGRGVLTLAPTRRYLINPGALVAGQYAIWDRAAAVVRFWEV